MLIAFEFDDSTLRAVIGRCPNRQFRVTGTFEFPIDSDVEATGQKLKEELREQGFNKADATIVLSRWQTEIREITVPPVPDEELPDLVRFQAKNEFIALTEEWPLDYIRLDQPVDGPHRVLAAAIAPKMLEQIQAICEAAEITLKHIVLQPLAIVNLFSDDHEIGKGVPQLLIRSSADRADLSIAVDGNLKITRSIRFATDAKPEKRSSLLISEARRTLAAAGKVLDTPIKHATVLGNEKRFKALGGDLTKGLGFTVDFIDAFQLAPLGSQFERPEQTAGFAALLGSLPSQQMVSKHAIDFLSPKRVIVRHPERNRWIVITGLVLAASLLMAVFAWSSLGKKQQKIDDLTETLNGLTASNRGEGQRPGVEQIMSEVGVIDQWKLRDINWLDELKQLSDHMLTPDDVIIDSLRVGAGRQSPRLNMDARLASTAKETELIDSLNARPYATTPERSTDVEGDQDYRRSLALTASYEPAMDSLVQKVTQQAADFLQKQQLQQQQAVPAEEPQQQ